MNLLSITRRTLQMSLFFSEFEKNRRLNAFGVVFGCKLMEEDTTTDVAIKSLKG